MTEIEEMAKVIIKQIPYDEKQLEINSEYAIDLSLKIADALIANGISDITAEKHRADVAEEALKMACIEHITYNNQIDNKNWVKSKRLAMYDRLIKQAEARLKERV